MRRLAPAGLLIAWIAGTVIAPVHAQSVNRATAAISVGPAVQVSVAFPDYPHYENLAAGDPDHPGRLITCAHAHPNDLARQVFHQYCYVSFDGGASWEPTLRIGDENANAGDPTAVYGRGDDVYVAALLLRESEEPTDPDPDNRDPELSRTVVYKSADGGRTWSETSRFQFIDREFIDIDRSDGEYAGRIYVVGQGVVRNIAGAYTNYSLQIFRSLDDGKTFLGPVHAEYPAGSIIFGVGTGAILSDGTFVIMFGLTKPGRNQSLEQEPTAGPNAELHVIMSKTGGATFTKSHKIADVTLDRPRSEGGILTQLAVDRGSEAFKDRLYAVFPAIVNDRIQVQLSYSADMGVTWSAPVTVNDDRSPEDGSKGPDHMLPAVAVNEDGVVLVSWYDRREAEDNLGWRLRAAASFDGGETFSASVPVTDVVNRYGDDTPWELGAGAYADPSRSGLSLSVGFGPFFAAGGHTSGLAADADGSFHPTWISNNGGTSQLWSAAIRVDGTVAKNGAAELAELEDISKSVALELSQPRIDRSTGEVTITARLKNTSKDTVQGPVYVRVLTLESMLGVAAVTNADNGEHGTGAVWDFTDLLTEGTLGSMQVSASRVLTFRVTDLRPLRFGEMYYAGLVNLTAKVLGKVEKSETKEEAQEPQL